MNGGYVDSAIETLEDMGYYDETEMTVGLDCCPHYVPYGSDCDQCDEEEADNAMGLTVPNKHVIYTDRPFPAHIFKVTHPLRQVKLDHSDVAETHRQNAPHYMSVLKEKQHAKRA